MKTNEISPSINNKSEDLLLYNPSSLNLANKKNDLNDITKYNLPGGQNNMIIDSMGYSNDKNKGINSFLLFIYLYLFIIIIIVEI